MDPDFIANGLLWALVFIFSLTAHEASHALVALWGGDDTAYQGGQVSLNPIPHMKREPIGMIVVPLASYIMGGFMMGWASAPYDPYWAARHPKRSALMAMAGPASNLLISLGAVGLLHLGHNFGIFGADALGDTLLQMLVMLYRLNLLLFVFNLIPLPPLDGAEAILLFFPANQAEKIRATIGQVGIFGIFIAWMILNRIISPLFAFSDALLLPFLTFG